MRLATNAEGIEYFSSALPNAEATLSGVKVNLGMSPTQSKKHTLYMDPDEAILFATHLLVSAAQVKHNPKRVVED